MQTVKFKYGLSQKVYIPPIEMYGNIVSLLQDLECVQYRVVYWCNGERHVQWLYEFEIEAGKN